MPVIHRFFLWLAVVCTVLGLSYKVSAATDSQATLSGKITNHSDSSLRVTLKPLEKNPLAIYDGYAAQVAADGSFQFTDIEPGKYILIAQGAGLVPAEYGAMQAGESGTPIELKAGEHRAGIVFTLARKHVVCGKVTDQSGAPVANADVYTYFHRKEHPWLMFESFETMHTTTDAAGDYRFPDLPPGEYFVQANTYNWYSKSANLTQLEAENFNNADAIEVGPDDSTQCQENVRIQPRTGYYGWKIRGKITDYAAIAGKDLVLSVISTNRSGAERWYQSGFAEKFNPEQSFELDGIPNGRYRLVLSRGRFPQNWDEKQPPRYHELASQEITIKDGNVDDVTLQPVPLASISGHVNLDSITHIAACPIERKLHFSIQRDDDQFHDVEVNENGSFSFPEVPVGTYMVRLSPLLHTAAYLKSIELDGHTVEGRKIEVASAGAHVLNVVISGDRENAAGHSSASEHWEQYAEQWAHPKASVSGKVKNITPGYPIHVKLWSVRFNSERSYEYSTLAAQDGSFQFENVDPGVYVLVALGKGYVTSEYGALHPGLEGRAISITAGQHLDNLTLAATPKGPSLCGKVVDENDQPIPYASVYAWNAAFTQSGLMTPNISSGKDGIFQLHNLPPGKYSIWASVPPIINGKIWTPGTPSNLTLDSGSYQQVDVNYDHYQGCKYVLRLRTTATYHIRGKLPEVPHGPDEVFNLQLEKMTPGKESTWAQSLGELAPSSTFDFNNVPPGQYILQLSGPGKISHGFGTYSGPLCRSPWNLLASQKVVVTNQDLDLAIDLNSVASVNGHVRFEDIPADWKFFQAESQELNLQPDRSFCPISTHLDSQGTVSFHGMQEGNYRINMNLRWPLYVKSVLLNGQPMKDKRIALVSGEPMKLEVVVSGKGGQVNASIIPSGLATENYLYKDECSPQMSVGPYVFLIPDPIPADGSGVVWAGRTQANDYEAGGVTPGRYRAVAGENYALFGFAANQYWVRPMNTKYLQAVAALGTPITVGAGQKVKVALKNKTVEIQNLSAALGKPLGTEDHCQVSCSYDDFWNGEENADLQSQR